MLRDKSVGRRIYFLIAIREQETLCDCDRL